MDRLERSSCSYLRGVLPRASRAAMTTPARQPGARPPEGSAVAPTPDLVPEEPEASGESGSDRSLKDHATTFPVGVGDRRLLDHEAALGDDDHQGRVIEVTLTPSLPTRGDRLEHLSA